MNKTFEGRPAKSHTSCICSGSFAQTTFFLTTQVSPFPFPIPPAACRVTLGRCWPQCKAEFHSQPAKQRCSRQWRPVQLQLLNDIGTHGFHSTASCLLWPLTPYNNKHAGWVCITQQQATVSFQRNTSFFLIAWDWPSLDWKYYHVRPPHWKNELLTACVLSDKHWNSSFS